VHQRIISAVKRVGFVSDMIFFNYPNFISSLYRTISRLYIKLNLWHIEEWTVVLLCNLYVSRPLAAFRDRI
jgi:hypothetical protein